jgi:hypothetical protein
MNCKFSDEDLRTVSFVKLQKALKPGNAVHAAEFYVMVDVSSSPPPSRDSFCGLLHDAVRYYTGICLEDLSKTTKRLMIAGVSAEIRIEHLANTNLERYCHADLPRAGVSVARLKRIKLLKLAAFYGTRRFITVFTIAHRSTP